MWRHYPKAHLPVIYQDRLRFISCWLKSLCFAGRHYESQIERYGLVPEGREMERLHVGSKRAAHPC